MIKQILKRNKIINDAYTKYKWREQRRSYGTEHPDKTFYVIRRAGAKVGLFSLVLTTLGYIKYALEKGYIPVVDMTNEDNSYMQKERGGNVWEYFFEQPCGYTLKDIQKSKHVILGNGLIDGSVPYPDGSMVYDAAALAMWQETAAQYLRVKKELLQEAKERAGKLMEPENTLGVLLRGTDYVNTRPKNHPIQPTVEQAMETIDHILAQRHYENIYLATEDAGIYGQMTERYGAKIISMQAQRYRTTEQENINDISLNKREDRYSLGKEYLLNILLLAGCDYLVAGNAGGSQGALLFRSKLEDMYFFNLGNY